MKSILLAVLTVVLLFPTKVCGIILMGSGDPTYNTTPPPGDRGWKYQGPTRNPGSSVSDLGIVLDKRHVLVAKHLSIITNSEFVINGITNIVTLVIPHTNANIDLTMLKMKSSNAFASLGQNYPQFYEGTSPVGKPCTIFGMGQQRGEVITSELVNTIPFVMTNITSSTTQFYFDIVGGDPWMKFAIEQSTNLVTWEAAQGTYYAPCTISITKSSDYSQAFYRVRAITTVTNGWRLGPLDLVKRWGENTIESVAGGFLITAFDLSSNNPNECTITPYDSSGGLFIQDTDGKWKLAGINYGSWYWPWSHDMGLNVFSAALFDQTGLWYDFFGSPGSYYQSPTGQPIPTRSYHTAIAPNIPWLKWAMTQ